MKKSRWYKHTRQLHFIFEEQNVEIITFFQWIFYEIPHYKSLFDMLEKYSETEHDCSLFKFYAVKNHINIVTIKELDTGKMTNYSIDKFLEYLYLNKFDINKYIYAIAEKVIKIIHSDFY